MPWLENNIFKFSADGMIHTTGREEIKPVKHSGRKEIINEITYRDAHVCLTCPLPPEECTGERECFLRRKKELEKEKRNVKNGE